MRTLRWSVVVLCLSAAAIALSPARPAAAGAAAAGGYVWASQPATASYLAATGYEYNSAGGDIEITRHGTGRYQVRFEGMAAPGGVAHATAYGVTSGFCTIAGWRRSGADELVSVRCFDGMGAPADLRFLAHFTNRQPDETFAYFWSDQAAPADSYTPTPAYSFDSTGSPPLVERVTTGEYFVYVGAVDEVYPDYEGGRFQVTAYGKDPVHCEQGTVNDELPAPITVRCYDADGDPVDSRFTFSYAHGVNLLGSAAPTATAWIGFTSTPRNPAFDWLVTGWSSPGGEPAVSHLDTGVFVVTFPGIAGDHGYATAGADTNGPGRCHVVAWAAFGDDVSVIVACHDGGTGEPADLEFTLAYLPEAELHAIGDVTS